MEAIRKSPNAGKNNQFDTSIFRERINQLCRDKGLTREKLANMAGISTSIISKWLNGVKDDITGGKKFPPPSVDKLMKIADALNVSCDYLIGLSEFRTPENDYIGNKTGLSDEAIDTLKSIHKLDIINADIANNIAGEEYAKMTQFIPYISSFIGCLKKNENCTQFIDGMIDYTIAKYHDGKYHQSRYDKRIALNGALYRIQNGLTSILNEMDLKQIE